MLCLSMNYKCVELQMRVCAWLALRLYIIYMYVFIYTYDTYVYMHIYIYAPYAHTHIYMYMYAVKQINKTISRTCSTLAKQMHVTIDNRYHSLC